MSAFMREIERWPAERQDEWQERAAIKEYDAGLPRARAEFEAFREIAAAQQGFAALQQKRGA
jgi:hypothetical protein